MTVSADDFRLEGAPNFRDLGGHTTADGRRVRTGRIFRSGVLSDLTDDDVARLDALGLARVVDLRGLDEVERRSNRLPPGVQTVHVPVGDVSAAPSAISERLANGDVDGLGATRLIEGNRAFARELRSGFADALHAVMEVHAHPVIVHCTAGKDRAGFASALVLWALGVSDDVVMYDYLLSNERLAERHARMLADAAARLPDVTPLREMLEVRVDYLGAARDAIDTDYGSVDAFLRDGLGVADDVRAEFQRALLEP